MDSPILALIIPLSRKEGDEHPAHPIVLPPETVPPSDAHPEHPIVKPPDPNDPHPEHPIYVPIEPPEGAHPEHPIYIPVYPAHPIVVPPFEGDVGSPSHPINKPPNDEPGWAFVYVPGQGWEWIQFVPGTPKPPSTGVPKR